MVEIAGNYRMEAAERSILSAEILLKDGDYKGAINRSYYTFFHCMRAVLAIEGIDFKKHSAVIAYFRKNYNSLQTPPSVE